MGNTAQGGDQLDLGNAEDRVQISRKIHCSRHDATPVVFTWEGRMYSRLEGERDRHLFNLLGMNIRQCGTIDDRERGKGYRMVAREVMLYLDPVTGEVLRQWENPWTGESVEVQHVANDPVNMHAPIFPIGRDGNTYNPDLRFEGGWVFSASEIPLFYTNTLGGDFQDYVGGHYHAMEIFDFMMREEDLLDAKGHTARDVALAWVRIAQFLPWMKMGSRPGLMVANATGRKLASFEELPRTLKNEIAENYPDYTQPPPLDDRRPNATSWSSFRKKLEEKRDENGH